MSNTGTIDWNKVIDQVSNNFIEWGLFIGFIIFLVIICFVIYNKIMNKSEGDILKIKTKDIDSKGDVIIGKGNIKNK